MPGLRWKDLSAYVRVGRRPLWQSWKQADGDYTGSQMSKVNSSAPRVLARIARIPNTVMLEMTQEAMQLGLLEPALVATVMLSCGHHID